MNDAPPEQAIPGYIGTALVAGLAAYTAYEAVSATISTSASNAAATSIAESGGADAPAAGAPAAAYVAAERFSRAMGPTTRTVPGKPPTHSLTKPTGGGPQSGTVQNRAAGETTAGGAAFRALRQAVPRSVSEDIEYGGLIYRLNGRYHPTAPVPGGPGSVDVWDALSQVPKGAEIVGDYHTHPSVGPDPIYRTRWWRNGEGFSGTDLPYLTEEERALTTPTTIQSTDYFEAKTDLSRPQVAADAFTSFLSTPSGRFGVYNVQRDSVFYFSPSNQLLPPGKTVPAASYAYH